MSRILALGLMGTPFNIYYHLHIPMPLNELQKTQMTEITSLKAALQAQGSELASLKQSQQQLNARAKLSALVETSEGKAQLRRAVYLKP